MTEPIPAAQYAGPSERHIQEQLFHLKRWKQNQDWRWEMLFPIPNGQFRPGTRPEPGLEDGAGVPDVMLAVPAGPYAGCFIELKRPGKRPRENQRRWHLRLRQQGYYVAVCHSLDEAAGEIEQYLELEGT